MIELPISYITVGLALHVAELAGLITLFIMMVFIDDHAR